MPPNLGGIFCLYIGEKLIISYIFMLLNQVT